jgi:polysaccharide deacetylase family protein (PEP-CTERM system associated)
VPHAFSVDLEDWFHVLNLTSVVPQHSWDEQESRVEKNVRKLLDLLEINSTRATFFVLGWVAEKHPQLIRDVAEAGHEIASHGMLHQLIYKMTPDEFRTEMIESKSLIEDVVGKEVIGFRASNFSITRGSLWALDILAEVGFKYDTSIFPFRRRRYGIADSPKRPHVRRLSNGMSIIEIPPSVVQVAGRVLPVAGGGYFRLLPYAVTQWAVRKIEKERRPFCFYLHPWELDPDQPKVRGLNPVSKFLHYQNLKRTEPRLIQMLSDFEFNTYAEIADVM